MPAENLQHEEVRKIVLEQLIKGESPEVLLENLKKVLPEDTAESLFSNAASEYESLKKSGRLLDAEYDLAFRKRRMSRDEVVGIALISLGALLTAGSYLLAAPGHTYTIFIGLIGVGVWRFLSR